MIQPDKSPQEESRLSQQELAKERQVVITSLESGNPRTIKATFSQLQTEGRLLNNSNIQAEVDAFIKKFDQASRTALEEQLSTLQENLGRELHKVTSRIEELQRVLRNKDIRMPEDSTREIRSRLDLTRDASFTRLLQNLRSVEDLIESQTRSFRHIQERLQPSQDRRALESIDQLLRNFVAVKRVIEAIANNVLPVVAKYKAMVEVFPRADQAKFLLY